jgi:phosphoribosylformylglycinamidine (FGAM) synthase PurS component
MLWEVDVHLREAAAVDLATAGRDLGLDLRHARTATGWLVEGELDRSAVERLAARLLTDPVTEVCRVAEVADATLLAPPDVSPSGGLTGGLVLHVLPKPGVTDPAAESARAAMALLGVEAKAVRSLRKYWLPAGVAAEQAAQLAWKRLASEAIHEVVIGKLTLTGLTGGGRWTLVRETVPLDGLDDAALEAISRQRCLALTADELRAVRDHFARPSKLNWRRLPRPGANTAATRRSAARSIIRALTAMPASTTC